MTREQQELTERSVAVIRALMLDMIERAGSGHPGAALALAPLGYALYRRFLRLNPSNPGWDDRDRFVLSAGHASVLQYALLHLTGHPLDMADLREFRRLGSRTPGHPERGVTPGVEMTTGPLGQGLATGVGMAMAERYLARRFNRPGHRIVDHRTVVVASDGDLMEGVSQEAISLAGQLRLRKLLVCYDNNGITIDGTTELSFDREDQESRFRASGWHVERVLHCEDPEVLLRALRRATRSAEPSLLILHTEIGYPAKVRGTPAAHGGPLGADEVARIKREGGLDPELSFHVPEEVAQHLSRTRAGAAADLRWQRKWQRWSVAHPALRDSWDRCHGDGGVQTDLVAPPVGEVLSPRNAGRLVLERLERDVPTMLGGAADLVDSTKTMFPASTTFTASHPGRNIAFGVREHGMACAVNGMALHGGIVKPYGSTFLAFSDQMRPAVRLSALMRLPVLWVWTHDSIAIGPDGPTHQPVEQLAGLRALPDLWVLRPCDANETIACWRAGLARTAGPVALVLARQAVPNLVETARHPDGPARGGYVLWESSGPVRIVLLAAGSEVHPVLAAAKRLSVMGVGARVVSLPCWELFEQQDDAYRESVLLPGTPPRLAVEAASALGWHRWVGPSGEVLSMNGFGASADGDTLLAHFGFGVDRIVRTAHRLAERRPVGPVQSEEVV